MIEAIRERRWLGGACVLGILLVALPALQDRTSSNWLFVYGALTLVAVVGTAFRWPLVAAGLMLVLGSRLGGTLALITAPIVLLLVYWANTRRLHTLANRPVFDREEAFQKLRPRSRSRIGAFVLACLLSLLLLPLGLPGGGGGAGGSSQWEPSGSSGQPDWLSDAVGTVLRFIGLGGDNPAGEVVESGGVAPPEPETEWWKVVAFIVVVALLLTAAFFIGRWLWRRLRPTPVAAGEETPQQMVDRLERLGESVGRRRLGHEGVATYARALSLHTGDERLVPLGNDLSDELYQKDGQPSLLAGRFAEIEADPPEAPPEPPPPSLRERLRSRLTEIRTSASNNRGAVAIALTVIALVGYAIVVGIFNDESNLAFADDALDSIEFEPPELLDDQPAFAVEIDERFADSDDVTSTQTCTVIVFEDGTLDVWSIEDAYLAGDSRRISTSFGDGTVDTWASYTSAGVGSATYTATVESQYWQVWGDIGFVESDPLGDFSALDELNARDVVRDRQPDGSVIVRHVFGADWYERVGSMPHFVELVWIDDAPWTLTEFISVEGVTDRVEMRFLSGEIEYWEQVQVGDAPGIDCAPGSEELLAAQLDKPRE